MRTGDYEVPRVRRYLFLVALLFALLTLPADAIASGWGLTGYYGAGDFNLTAKPYLQPGVKASGEIEKSGFGIVYDSNLAREETFGGRFSVVVENSTLKSDDFEGSETLSGISFQGMLTIALYSSPNFKFWLGPELTFGGAEGSGRFTKDASPVIIGFGAALGSNVHLGDSATLSLAFGVRAENYNEGNNQFGAEKALKGDSSYVYSAVTLFYRTEGDSYGAK